MTDLIEQYERIEEEILERETLLSELRKEIKARLLADIGLAFGDIIEYRNQRNEIMRLRLDDISTLNKFKIFNLYGTVLKKDGTPSKSSHTVYLNQYFRKVNNE